MIHYQHDYSLQSSLLSYSHHYDYYLLFSYYSNHSQQMFHLFQPLFLLLRRCMLLRLPSIQPRFDQTNQAPRAAGSVAKKVGKRKRHEKTMVNIRLIMVNIWLLYG